MGQGRAYGILSAWDDVDWESGGEEVGDECVEGGGGVGGVGGCVVPVAFLPGGGSRFSGKAGRGKEGLWATYWFSIILVPYGLSETVPSQNDPPDLGSIDLVLRAGVTECATRGSA